MRPSSYSIHLDPLDGIILHNNFLGASDLSIGESSAVLRIAPLEFRRLWNITVFAYDCEHHPLTGEMELGIEGTVHIHVANTLTPN